MDDSDIQLVWRAAKMLIERHGEEANLVASIRADQMAEEGDAEGETVWRLIRQAIIDLQARPAKGEKLN
jgi:hypothetical protein